MPPLNEDDIFRLCDVIRETAFQLHVYHKHGHMEKIYENGLCHRLRKLGLQVEQQVPIVVRDEDGTILGEFFCDMRVERQLICELKACNSIVDEHVAQCLGYLRATNTKHGLLINFGAPKLQIKKLVL